VLVGEDIAAVLDEERVIVALVLVVGVVLGTRDAAVGYVFFGVDGADGTDVGLIAGRAGRALVEVDIENAVADTAIASAFGVWVSSMTPLPPSASANSKCMAGSYW
jgi:hypothetical protein